MDIRPLTVDAGGSKTFVVTVYSDASKTTLHPLAGYTAKMQVREKVGGVVFSELTSPSGGITINTTTSEITVVIPAADTASFKSKMVYDIKLTKADDTVYPVGGEITVVRTVTS
jgi:hypothetical protein